MPLEELTFTVEGVTVRLASKMHKVASYTGAKFRHCLVPATVEYVLEGRVREEVSKTDYFVYDSDKKTFITPLTKLLPFHFSRDRNLVEQFNRELSEMGKIYSVLILTGYIKEIILE